MRLQSPERMQNKAAMEANFGLLTPNLWPYCSRGDSTEAAIFHQILVLPSVRNSARFLTWW
jgi:hypothetical protein